MIAVLSAAAVASLLGSGHCVAMCGALAVLAGQGGRLRLQAWFHAARLTVYVLLGAAAGAIGHGVDDLGALAGVERAATILAALAVLVSLAGRLTPKLGGGMRTVMQSALRSVTSPSVRALLLGAMTALVPCGWLYAWVATVAATGNAASGALLMGVFGLGAVPLLVGATRITQWLRRGVLAERPRLVAALAIAAMLVTITLRGSALANVHRVLDTPGSTQQLVCHGGAP